MNITLLYVLSWSLLGLSLTLKLIGSYMLHVTEGEKDFNKKLKFVSDIAPILLIVVSIALLVLLYITDLLYFSGGI